jgi:hypothetical protein
LNRIVAGFATPPLRPPPQFDMPPLEDRSKYEKFDNDLLDCSSDEEGEAGAGGARGDKSDSDSDSIGSATDLQIRAEEEDFPQSHRLTLQFAEVTTNPGSSVYHAECESMATHEDDGTSRCVF